MNQPAAAFLESWHAKLAAEDLEGAAALFAPDCDMISPVLWKVPQGEGYAPHLVRTFFSCVENFRYRKDWVDDTGREIILEFEADIAGRSLVGIDRISLDAEGRIIRFEVMIRPLNALMTVAEAMRDKLAG